MENDFDDIEKLKDLNQLLEDVVGMLVKRLTDESELKIIIIDLLHKYEVENKQSWDNKLISLSAKSSPEEKGIIKDYIRIVADIRSLKAQRDQVQEAINSKKKIMDVRPR